MLRCWWSWKIECGLLTIRVYLLKILRVMSCQLSLQWFSSMQHPSVYHISKPEGNSRWYYMLLRGVLRDGV